MTPLGRSRASQSRSDASSLHGYFDGVVDGEAVGWCVLPGDLATHLTVEVHVDGVRVAEATASRRRDAVARAGFGDGRYGFNVPLPASLDDGGTHQIAVTAGGVLLPAAPGFLPGIRRALTSAPSSESNWTATRFTAENGGGAGAGEGNASTPRSGSTVVLANAPTEIRGYVEGITGNELFGWVVDIAERDAAVEVEARFDGAQLGRIVADQERPDVARAGYGAAHGFRFTLAAPPADGEHTVEVRTVQGHLAVPLEKGYVIVDAAGERAEGVILHLAKRGAVKPLAAPRETLQGRDGWLFEWPDRRTFDILRGAAEPPLQCVTAYLERVRERDHEVRNAGALLVAAILPTKLAAYPDRLPAGLSVDFSRRPADLVVAAARDRNVTDVVDLEGPLRHAKARGEVFTRTGRGLTWSGAFAAYRSLAKQLAYRIPGLDPLTPEALKLGELELVLDSLAALPRLGWTGTDTFPAAAAAAEEQEGEPRLDWSGLSTEYAVIEPTLARLAGQDAVLLRHRVGEEQVEADVDRRPGTALLIHDGSAARLAPFLAEHFNRTLAVVPAEDTAIGPLLAGISPAAVVEITAEQTLIAGY
jgi:hypothetical protein